MDFLVCLPTIDRGYSYLVLAVGCFRKINLDIPKHSTYEFYQKNYVLIRLKKSIENMANNSEKVRRKTELLNFIC